MKEIEVDVLESRKIYTWICPWCDSEQESDEMGMDYQNNISDKCDNCGTKIKLIIYIKSI